MRNLTSFDSSPKQVNINIFTMLVKSVLCFEIQRMDDNKPSFLKDQVFL